MKEKRIKAKLCYILLTENVLYFSILRKVHEIEYYNYVQTRKKQRRIILFYFTAIFSKFIYL